MNPLRIGKRIDVHTSRSRSFALEPLTSEDQLHPPVQPLQNPLQTPRWQTANNPSKGFPVIAPIAPDDNIQAAPVACTHEPKSFENSSPDGLKRYIPTVSALPGEGYSFTKRI